MIALAHVEKFFNENPDEITGDPQILRERLKRAAFGDGRLLMSSAAEDILGRPILLKICQLMQDNQEYAAITAGEITRPR